MGDLTVVFSEPVDAPLMHIVGLGGFYTQSAVTLGFSSELELQTSGLTMARISGSTEFTLDATKTKILNNDPTPASATGSGAASGTVRINGSGVTTLTFKIYMRGDGGLSNWSMNGHQGDQWLMAFTLPNVAPPTPITGLDNVVKSCPNGSYNLDAALPNPQGAYVYEWHTVDMNPTTSSLIGNDTTYAGIGPVYLYAKDSISGCFSLASAAVNLDPRTCPAPIDCNGALYLFQNEPTDVFKLDIATGVKTQIFNNLTSTTSAAGINAVGFNQTNGLFVGYNDATDQISVIGEGGAVLNYTVAGLPVGVYTLGDVSSAGIYYFAATGGTVIHKVDVNPFSSTFMQYLGALTSTSSSINDMVVNPVDGNLYTINGTRVLQRIDPVSGVRTNLGTVGGGTPAITSEEFGAMWSDAAGNLYITASVSGKTYKIPTPQTITSTGTGAINIAVYQSTTTASPSSDGANCASKPFCTAPAKPDVTQDIVYNTCPATTFDLTTLNPTPAAGTSLVWGTNGALPEVGAQVATPNAVGEGIYYLWAVNSPATDGCFSVKCDTIYVYITLPCNDCDTDGVPDVRDIDDDNDGVLDLTECPYSDPANTDTTAFGYVEDLLQSNFHSTLFKTATGYSASGSYTGPAPGFSANITPIEITPENGYPYTGSVILATSASVSLNLNQTFLLTTTGLWVTGYEGAVIDAAITTSQVMQKIPLPSGVNPQDVKKILASDDPLLLLTKQGKVYILGKGGESAYGDGSTAADATWHEAQVPEPVKSARTWLACVFALTESGKLYSWGENNWDGTNPVQANQNVPELMVNPLPSGVTPIQIAITGVSNVPTYVLLGSNGKVYTIGANNYGQLGNNTTTAAPTWQTVKDTLGTGDLLNIRFISANDEDANWCTVSAIDVAGNLYSWGLNETGKIGTGGYIEKIPVRPIGTEGRIVQYVEAGGHITPVVVEGLYCNTGHNVGGAFGDGTTATRTSYECNLVPGQAVATHLGDLVACSLCSPDADGDGCPDAVEAGINTTLPAVATVAAPFGANGYADNLETVAESGIPKVKPNFNVFAKDPSINACDDCDNDGVPNIFDLDDDNDGVKDTVEAKLPIGRLGVVATRSYGRYASISFGSETVTTYFSKIDSLGLPTFPNKPLVGQTSIDVLPVDSVVFSAADPKYHATTNHELVIYNGVIDFCGQTNIKFQMQSGSESDYSYLFTQQGTTIKGAELTADFASTSATTSTETPAYPTGPIAFRLYHADENGTNAIKLMWKSDQSPVYQVLSNVKLPNCDADGDGIANSCDLDSDGDGCSDAFESGLTASQVTNFSFPLPVGTTGLASGIPATAPTYSGAVNAAIATCTPVSSATPDTVTVTPTCPTCPTAAICPTANDVPATGSVTYQNCGLSAAEMAMGTATFDASGCLVWTPNGTQTDTVTTCVVKCVNGVCDTTYVVIPPPVAPVPAPNPDVNQTYVNIPVTGDVSTNDDNIPTGSTYEDPAPNPANPGTALPVINPDGTYTFTSPVPGVFTFQVPVVTPSGDTILVDLVITVLDPNSVDNAPTANVDIAETPINTPVTLATLSNDQPGQPSTPLDPATVAVIDAPSNGTTTVDPVTGNITYTPNAGFVGTDTLTYEVKDVDGNITTAQQIITVLPANAPNSTSAADDYKTTPFNTPVSGSVKTNDTDAQGNTQTITAQTTTIPGKGTLVLAADGTYTFTPVPGFYGPVEFPYTTTDNGTTPATANATLHILVAPPVPAPNPDVNQTYVNIPVTGDVSTNDDNIPTGSTYEDPAPNPANPGTALPVINPDGTYTFTSPVPGVFTFQVPVVTPGGDTILVDLVITVLDPNSTSNAPTANVDIAETPINTPVTLATLSNDQPGQPSTPLVPSSVMVIDAPSNGTTTVDPVTGNITYTPNAGFVGTDTLTYEVKDVDGNVTTAQQIITVLPANAPNSTSAADDYKTTPFNTPTSGSVKTNDTDAQGNTQTITPQTTTIPGKGTLVLAADGTYTFTPVPGFYGPVEFPYTTTDNGTTPATANATLHILVAPPVPAPNPDVNATYVNVPVNGDVSTNDDLIPTGSTYGVPAPNPGNPGTAIPVVNPDGTYTFTSPVPGVFTFEVPLILPNGDTMLVELVINVLDPASTTNTPTATVDIAETPMNTPVTLMTLSNDASGNPTAPLVAGTVIVTMQPPNGTTTVDPITGNIVYMPNPGFMGMDTLTYEVKDANGNVTTAQQIITISAPSAPNSTLAADDYVVTPANTPVGGNVLTNDTDAQGDSQSVTPQTTTIPGKGTLVLNADGTYVFTPVSGFVGPVEFPYTITDSNTSPVTANATLHILVAPANTACPVICLPILIQRN
jgi:CshA-type fibril repeat protein